MWHASFALHGPAGSVPWPRYSLKLRAFARESVARMLAGVGEGDTRRERTGEIVHVLHARRRLAAAELALLTAEWCALPAVADAGSGQPW